MVKKKTLFWIWIEFLIFLRIYKICGCGDIFPNWKFKRVRYKSGKISNMPDEIFKKQFEGKRICPQCQWIYLDE